MPLLKGALIEYGTDFLGPIPNIVIFQFNPESLTRNIQIPSRPSGAQSRETNQVGDFPGEKITLTAHFSAADQLNDDRLQAREFGIGPQLAGLEKMVQPARKIRVYAQKAIDAIGDLVGVGSKEEPCTQPIPREKYPRILFIWGLTRILPVIIESMSITEQQYDSHLNPIQAEVSIGLAVINVDKCSDDGTARGALEYSEIMKDAQAMLNLANTTEQMLKEPHLAEVSRFI